MENNQQFKSGPALNVSIFVYDGKEHHHLYQLADDSPDATLDTLLVKVAKDILRMHEQSPS